MLRLLKRLAERCLPPAFYKIATKTALTAVYLLKNQGARWIKNPKTPWVCAHTEFDPEASAAYARMEFEEYMRDGGFTAEDFKGKVVLELGPGDNLGVAMLFLNAGAESVVCVDRFHSLRPAADQLQVYHALERELGTPLVGRFVEKTGDGLRFAETLRYLSNLPGERLDTVIAAASIDMVVSRAVLEHVYDVQAVVDAMDRCLKPRGVMIHEIDFRDHGIYSSRALHPLTFLTIPESLWKRMSDRIGAPNRKLMGFFREAFHRLDYQVSCLQLLTLGGGENRSPAPIPATPAEIDGTAASLIKEIRPQLGSRFRRLSDIELSISGIFLIARKPEIRNAV